MKGAGSQHIENARWRAGNRLEGHTLAEARQGLDERCRVGVPGGAEQGVRRRLLDEEAAVEDRDAMADFGNDAEIVSDQDDGHTAGDRHLLQQLENLLLHRHVERRSRLVGNDQLRIRNERRGDNDALFHSA